MEPNRRSRKSRGRAAGIAVIALAAIVPAAAWAADSAASAKAGVSAAVRGDVKLAGLQHPVAYKVGSGDGIFLGDHITSAINSGMQILLLDQTVFTIGPDADLVVDNFVYDPASGTGKLAATVTKGAFRFITGSIAANNPDDMEVTTPAATIGIRGTMVAGRVDGTSAMIVLLGPGYDGDSTARIGRVTVANKAGSVELYGAGYGTFVPGPDQSPQTPFRIPLDQLIRLDLAAGGAPPGGAPAGQNGNAVAANQVGVISGEVGAATQRAAANVTVVTGIGSGTITTIQSSGVPPLPPRCVAPLGAFCVK